MQRGTAGAVGVDQGQFENMLLGLVIVDLTIAAIVLGCLNFDGKVTYRIVIFAAALGAAAGPLAFPLLFPDAKGGAVGGAVFGALAGGFFAFIILAFLSWSQLKGLSGEIRNAIDVKRWLPEADMPRLTPRDRVRRVFVAVSAATGAVVFSMFGLDAFWKAFWEEIAPLNIVGISLAFVAGLFLVGPAQAFVFERGSNEPESGKELTWALQSGFDTRAAFRLAILLVMGVQFGVLLNCVNASVRTGDAQVLYTILNAALPPAIVSYYMSAALQISPPRTIPHARKAALYGGAILNYGFALIILVNFLSAELMPDPDGGSNYQPGIAYGAIMSPVLAIGLALAFSAVTTYAPAVAMAHVIERRTGPSAMAYVAAALALAAVLQALAFTIFVWMNGLPLENMRFGSFIGGVVGWIAGLWASGFPKLLTTSRPAASPAPADAAKPS